MIDPIDYPVTPNRGYRVPPDDVGGVNVANDVPGDLNRLAADIDVDVEAVAAAAAGSVQPSRRVDTGTGLVGGGDLSAGSHAGCRVRCVGWDGGGAVMMRGCRRLCWCRRRR